MKLARSSRAADQTVAAVFYEDIEIMGGMTASKAMSSVFPQIRQRAGDRRPDRRREDFGGGPLTLVELHGDRRWRLYPHLEVFGEGIRALRRGIDAGLLDVLRPLVSSRDEFGRRLLAIGLIDRSHNPLLESGS